MSNVKNKSGIILAVALGNILDEIPSVGNGGWWNEVRFNRRNGQSQNDL